MHQYEKDVAAAFEKVMLIHKLRETRALTGFTRVFPAAGTSLQDKMRLLRREPPRQGPSTKATLSTGETGEFAAKSSASGLNPGG
jgi:hypothetical protein